MRTTAAPITVAALGLLCLSPGCHKEPNRGPAVPATESINFAPVVTAGGNTGGTPGKGLRETSPNVTVQEPGVLHSPSLPALAAGGYFRIVTFDSPNGTDFEFTAANTTGYGLFAASSPKLVERDDGPDELDPSTTLNPVWLDGSKTAGAYSGSNQYLVLRANTGGRPLFLNGYSRSAIPPALRNIADGQTVSVPLADIRKGDGVLSVAHSGRNTSYWFVLVAVASPDPKLTVSDAVISGGNGGTTDATFTVSLSAAAAANVTVRYETVNGTAAAGTDFKPVNGTLTFLPGETSKAVLVPVTRGATRGRDGDFFLTLASATNAVIANGVGLAVVRAHKSSRPPR